MLLYYITDRKGFAGSAAEQFDALLCRICEAARAGVDYIQLREKDLSPHDLEALAAKALLNVRDNSSATKFLINSRADIALAIGADGVHLPEGDLPALEVRALWMQCSHQPPLIGVSAHTVADVRRAQTDGANFAVLAPIFEKARSSAPGIGTDALRQACTLMRSQTDVPQRNFVVLALSGVTIDNARACLDAGASGVAGIRLFQQGNVFDTVGRLREMG